MEVGIGQADLMTIQLGEDFDYDKNQPKVIQEWIGAEQELDLNDKIEEEGWHKVKNHSSLL